MIINIMPASSRLGGYVIDKLLKLGVRADQIVGSVRNIEKAQFLADKGISIRLADYNKKETLQKAFKDTDVLLLIPTFARVEERILQHFNAVEAAKEDKVKRVIFAGFMTASLASVFKVAPFMLYAESKLRVSGLDWTIVRNGRYLEEVSLSVSEMVETEIWERPIQNAGVAYISREDLARAIAAVCINNQHPLQTYELTGIKAYKMPELTEMISKITGKPIEYKTISIEEWVQRAREAGRDEYMIKVIASLYRAVNNGEFEKVTNHVEKLTGRPPETAESFIRRNIS